MNTVELTENHWKWVRGLLDALQITPEQAVKAMGYTYKTAFAHGLKHGKEPAVQADAKRPCAMCTYCLGFRFNFCAYCGTDLRTA